MRSFIKKHKRLTLIVSAVLLIYFSGCVLFSQRTFPNTKVNGNDRSLRPKDGVFLYQSDDRSIRFNGKFGETANIRESQFNYRRNIVGQPRLDQNAFAWPLAIFSSHEYTVAYEVSYDENKLAFLLLDSAFDEEGTQTENAYLQIDDEGARIVPEVEGTRVNIDVLKEDVLKAFGDTLDEVDVRNVYTEPTVRKDDPGLLAEFEKVKKIVAMKITYRIGDAAYVLAGRTLLNMYEQDEQRNWRLNHQALEDWVVKMAVETDTYGTTRQFEATGLGPVTVPPGIYGWQMNVSETLEELERAIQAGESVELQPAYNYYAGEQRGSSDIGNTYIEVDLSRQHLWAYVDGSLFLDTDIVSGVLTHATPVGVNYIWSREENVKLSGRNFDGLSEYETPVHYWMPINYGGVGLHDAPWRTEFGGEIYMNYGSHGCINLPPDVAEKLFYQYEVYTPVVVYESYTSYSQDERTY